MKKKVENTIAWILVIIHICMPVLIFGIAYIITVVKYPSLNEISAEFAGYERTNNTVVEIDNKWLNFGYSEIYLDSLLRNGNATGDWFIYDNKLYFSFYEENKDKQEICSIYTCDFYGKNPEKIVSVDINKIDHYKMVEVFDYAFYVSNGTEVNNGTKLDVIYPLENRQEEIAYNGNAYDYVETLRSEQSQQYTVIDDDKNPITIRNVETLAEYIINEETIANSEEGRTLLKFEHNLSCTISNNRILLTALIYSDVLWGDASYVTFEYCIENNKLVFQNYCEGCPDYFETFAY